MSNLLYNVRDKQIFARGEILRVQVNKDLENIMVNNIAADKKSAAIFMREI
jgi:hypothetical protein